MLRCLKMHCNYRVFLCKSFKMIFLEIFLIKINFFCGFYNKESILFPSRRALALKDLIASFRGNLLPKDLSLYAVILNVVKNLSIFYSVFIIQNSTFKIVLRLLRATLLTMTAKSVIQTNVVRKNLSLST
jgi:hypothetical protein